ncbi:hypothetical protein TGP89_260230A, partial [Toxoplasma gondii p89]
MESVCLGSVGTPRRFFTRDVSAGDADGHKASPVCVFFLLAESNARRRNKTRHRTEGRVLFSSSLLEFSSRVLFSGAPSSHFTTERETLEATFCSRASEPQISTKMRENCSRLSWTRESDMRRRRATFSKGVPSLPILLVSSSLLARPTSSRCRRSLDRLWSSSFSPAFHSPRPLSLFPHPCKESRGWRRQTSAACSGETDQRQASYGRRAPGTPVFDVPTRCLSFRSSPFLSPSLSLSFPSTSPSPRHSCSSSSFSSSSASCSLSSSSSSSSSSFSAFSEVFFSLSLSSRRLSPRTRERRREVEALMQPKHPLVKAVKQTASPHLPKYLQEFALHQQDARNLWKTRLAASSPVHQAHATTQAGTNIAEHWKPKLRDILLYLSRSSETYLPPSVHRPACRHLSL